MINLSLIPIFAFILILLPIVMISFFKSIRWALMLLGLTLVAGALSFLMTFILYKPLLLGWFESILTWRLGQDMAINQMEQISKGTIICIFSSFIILPLALVIFLIFKLIKKWLNKPLGPKVTIISPNEKSIVRKSLKFQKIGSGVISISTALILASTIASSTSIVLTPAYKNKVFNKMIKPFSFPLNYGNGYDKNWQRLYAFLDSANENKTGLSGLRELISFNSFKGDLSPEETVRLENALTKIDTTELNSYFSKIDDNSNLTDIGIRVILGKFMHGLDHKIMATDKDEIKEEADFDKFVKAFIAWANNKVNKNNLFLKNKSGVEKAIKSLLNQTHDYKDTYYFKNELAIKDLIKAAEKILADSNKEYDRLTAEKQNEDEQYEYDFRRMKSVADNLQNKINSFIILWKRIGSGNTSYVNNKYSSIPLSITNFVADKFITKDLHGDESITPPRYDEEFGNTDTSKMQKAPLGKKLRSSKLTASGNLTSNPNSFIQQYIKAYDDLKVTKSTKSIGDVSGTPEHIFYQNQTNYYNAKIASDSKLNELQRHKNDRSQKIQRINSTENAKNREINERNKLQRERNNLRSSTPIDKVALGSKETEKNNAQGDLTNAKNQLRIDGAAIVNAETELATAKQDKQQAKAALDAAESSLNVAAKKDLNDPNNKSDYDAKKLVYNNKKDDFEKTKIAEKDKKDIRDKAQNEKSQALKIKNNAQNNFNRLKNQYDNLKQKYYNDINRLDYLGRSDSSPGLIKDKIDDIDTLDSNLITLRTELGTIEGKIQNTNDEYKDLIKITNEKHNYFLQAKREYDRLSSILNNKRNTFENAEIELENNLSDINNDIDMITNYVKDENIKTRWDILLQNSIRIWEIKGNANSFTPPIPDIPKIVQSKRKNPGYEPLTYTEIAYTDKVKGGASIVYLERKVTYLNELLTLAREIKVSMEKIYNKRLEDITNSIVKILT